jgi:hypothetical protein
MTKLWAWIVAKCREYSHPVVRACPQCNSNYLAEGESVCKHCLAETDETEDLYLPLRNSSVPGSRWRRVGTEYTDGIH